MNEKFLIDYLKIIRYLQNDAKQIIQQIRTFKEDYFKSMLSELEENIIKDFNKFSENIDIKNLIFSNSVVQCIEKFVNSEMDYYTPGIRGLGRMSTYYPRFGGYYSKFLRNLTQKDIEIVQGTIKDIINYGYYSGFYLEGVENKITSFSPKSFDILFNEWIPPIYVQEFGKNLDDFLREHAILSNYYFCIKLSNETNLPKKLLRIQRIDKLFLIIRKYIDAGYILRKKESGFIKPS